MQLKELSKLINELYFEYKNIAYVGQILRDKYSILSVRKIYGVKLLSLISSQTLPPELVILLRTFIPIHKHMELNKRDKHTRKIYVQKVNDIISCIAYLKLRNRLPKNFKWDPITNEQILGRNALL